MNLFYDTLLWMASFLFIALNLVSCSMFFCVWYKLSFKREIHYRIYQLNWLLSLWCIFSSNAPCTLPYKREICVMTVTAYKIYFHCIGLVGFLACVIGFCAELCTFLFKEKRTVNVGNRTHKWLLYSFSWIKLAFSCTQGRFLC